MVRSSFSREGVEEEEEGKEGLGREGGGGGARLDVEVVIST